MAQDISLLGAVYQDVPAVQLPVDGGGSALFVDVSADTVVAEKLVEGFTAHDANGDSLTGTLKQLYIDPITFDYIPGYVMNNKWNYQNSENNRTDVYELEPGHRYYLGLGETRGTRFRAVTLSTNPVGTTVDIPGTTVSNLSNPAAYSYAVFAAGTNTYLAVTKDNTAVSGIRTYLADITPN